MMREVNIVINMFISFYSSNHDFNFVFLAIPKTFFFSSHATDWNVWTYVHKITEVDLKSFLCDPFPYCIEYVIKSVIV